MINVDIISESSSPDHLLIKSYQKEHYMSFPAVLILFSIFTLIGCGQFNNNSEECIMHRYFCTSTADEHSTDEYSPNSLIVTSPGQGL